MVFRRIRKGVKKVGKFAFGVAKKAAYARYGNRNGLSTLVRDVGYLKSMVNAEKKRQDVSVVSGTVAQFATAASGHYLNDITPIIPQGVTYNTRNGASIKMHSMILKFKFQQQSATINPLRFKIQVYARVGPTTAANIASMFDSNAFVAGSIYDYNSNRNPDSFPNFKLIATRKRTLIGDNISTQTEISDITIPIKFGKKGRHVRYDKDSNSHQTGQLFLVILADSGDGNANTGCIFGYSQRVFYYDN